MKENALAFKEEESHMPIINSLNKVSTKLADYGRDYKRIEQELKADLTANHPDQKWKGISCREMDKKTSVRKDLVESLRELCKCLECPEGWTTSCSEGVGNAPSPEAVYISILPSGQISSNGIYVAICFASDGNAIAIGCCRASSGKPKLPNGMDLGLKTDTKIKESFKRNFITYTTKLFYRDEQGWTQENCIDIQGHLEKTRGYCAEILNKVSDVEDSQEEPHDIARSSVQKQMLTGTNLEIYNLLLTNFNVILTGAPGTGKTYAAREVAKAISKDEWVIEDGKWKCGRIASVQFHPGYDYSDFVIGMKPVLITETGKEVEKRDGKYFLVGTEEKVEDLGKAQVSFRWKDGIFKKFADKAKQAYEEAPDKKNAPKFVFLIDEINRADLSRVFGELFSLLEEEYRYPNEKGTGITLQNGENFAIPENLYIIGTMNDIDRSVESMDFALRRRFAWYEVKAKDSEIIIEKKVKDVDGAVEKLKATMKALNEMIAPPKDGSATSNQNNNDLKLGFEYQLGGAIFAKFEKYVGEETPFKKLWNNHIENILREYLRGRSNRDQCLERLKEAYNKALPNTDREPKYQENDGADKKGEEGVIEETKKSENE